MKSFKCELLLAAPVSLIYEALTTQHGIESWWTTSSKVGTSVGEHITIHFGDTYKVMHIETLHPFTEVRWSVTDAQLIAPGLTRTNEWIGTTIVFQLTPQSGKVTQLQLEHVGLTPQIECYEICSQGWNQFLGSLKTYVETGKGSPYVLQPTA